MASVSRTAITPIRALTHVTLNAGRRVMHPQKLCALCRMPVTATTPALRVYGFTYHRDCAPCRPGRSVAL